MSRIELMQLIQDTLLDVTGKDEVITEETDLVSSEILDSLDTMMFLMKLEESTGRSLEAIEVTNAGSMTVKALIDALSV